MSWSEKTGSFRVGLNLVAEGINVERAGILGPRIDM